MIRFFCAYMDVGSRLRREPTVDGQGWAVSFLFQTKTK